MQDKAKYIQLGVSNGVTSLDEIKEVYNKYAEGGPKRVHNNTSPTAELSTKLEDVVATKIRNDKHINHAYDIPYLEDKETKIIGYTVPTNALDSIAKYAGKTKHDLDEAVALAFESGYGRQPYFNYGTKNISDRAIGNMNYFKNYGSIPSHLFVRDYEYTKGGYNKDKPYTDQAPLEHAINFFRSGRYNTKLRAVDPETGKTINHTQKVKLEAKKLRKDPNYQKWKKQSGLDEYTGKAQQARDRQKAIDAENARKAKYRKEHPIKAYFKDVLGIKYDDGGLLTKADELAYINPSLVSYNTIPEEDVLIGEDFFTKKYRRPDGSTYTHVPLNDWTPTSKVYTAKDSKGNTLRSATGKLVTGNTQQEANNKLFWDNYNNVPLLTPKDPVAAAKEAASYIPFIGEGLDLYDIGKDVYSGNYGQAALGAGLFLLPEFLEKPIKKGFHLAGRYLPDLSSLKKDMKVLLNTPLGENPIKAVQRNRLYRRRWSSPKVEVGLYDYTGPSNSQQNALDLLESRINSSSINTITGEDGETVFMSPLEAFSGVKELDYVPVKTISETMQSKNPLDVLPAYLKLNMKPGVRFDNYIYLNPGSLKKEGLGRTDVVKMHEYHHQLNQSREEAAKEIFNTSHLPKRVQNYLNTTEIAARGAQLKSYFGFDKDQKLTGNMLKYAAEHYSDDVFDNNMQQLFSSIKDWDAAAEWFNKYSFKYGGSIAKK